MGRYQWAALIVFGLAVYLTALTWLASSAGCSPSTPC